MNNRSNSLFRKEIDRLHMSVSETVHAELDANWGYVDSHKPSFTRIYAIIDGEGIIYCQDREIPMTKGNIYILPAGIDFAYTCLTDMEKLYFHINLFQSNSYDIFHSMKKPAVITGKASEIKKAAQWLERNDMYGAMHIKNWLMDNVLLGFEMTQTDLGPIEEYSPLVRQVIQYIESHLRSALTVSDIVSELYVSESRLQKAFRSEVGVPLGRYITDRLFFTAEQQLRMSDRSIKEISEELGFCDPFYFSRRFSRRYGVPPSIYRKQLNL